MGAEAKRPPPPRFLEDIAGLGDLGVAVLGVVREGVRCADEGVRCADKGVFLVDEWVVLALGFLFEGGDEKAGSGLNSSSSSSDSAASALGCILVASSTSAVYFCGNLRLKVFK